MMQRASVAARDRVELKTGRLMEHPVLLYVDKQGLVADCFGYFDA